jgi:hypothetical protein
VSEKKDLYQQELSQYRPGDKIYKLLDHSKAVVKGQRENYLIKVKKI